MNLPRIAGPVVAYGTHMHTYICTYYPSLLSRLLRWSFFCRIGLLAWCLVCKRCQCARAMKLPRVLFYLFRWTGSRAHIHTGIAFFRVFLFFIFYFFVHFSSMWILSCCSLRCVRFWLSFLWMIVWKSVVETRVGHLSRYMFIYIYVFLWAVRIITMHGGMNDFSRSDNEWPLSISLGVGWNECLACLVWLFTKVDWLLRSMRSNPAS